MLPLLFAFITSSQAWFNPEHSDVCVLGAGAGGAYAAWKLTQKGHDVALFDTADRVGGNCDTYADFAKGIFVPLGVVLYPAIDFVKDIITEAGLTWSEFDVSRALNTQFLDMRTGQYQDVPFPSDEEFYTSYAALLDVFDEYPQMDGIGGGYPAFMPPELAVPMGEFMELNGLNGLMHLLRFLSPGYDNLEMPAFFGLKLLRPVALNLLTPGGSIGINEGCSAFYEKITQPVKKLVLNANIFSVIRGPRKTQIFYTAGDGFFSHHSCDKLIIGYRPSEESMANVYPKRFSERQLYKQIETGVFGTGAFSFAAPDPMINPLQWNIHPENDFGFPTLPATLLTQILARDAEGNMYANAQMASRVPVDIEEVTATFKADIEALPGVESEVSVHEVKLHAFAYQPTYEAAIDGFYGKMEALQGERNTWFVGSSMSFEAQFDCWAYSERIVQLVDAQLNLA